MVLKKTLQRADKVYIKGSERVAFLEQLLHRPVIDLDIFNFRGVNENKYPTCSLHYSELRCALRKACTYRDYLRKYLEK